VADVGKLPMNWILAGGVWLALMLAGFVVVGYFSSSHRSTLRDGKYPEGAENQLFEIGLQLMVVIALLSAILSVLIARN